MRDLMDERDEVVAGERSRVAAEGWGARLLALQQPNGKWVDEDGEAWLTTTYQMIVLKEMGVDPADARVRRAYGLVRDNVTWHPSYGHTYVEGETEPCVNGAILAVCAYFGEPDDTVVDRLLSEQLADGGWNCKAPPSTRSSFHTTIRVLEGLLEYEKARAATTAVAAARSRAHEYLLERRMFRSLSSGEVIDKHWLRFAFPSTWHYDVLRGLDYLRNAGVAPDERVAEAIGVVEQRRHQNGLWPLNTLHPGRRTFDMEAGVGKASYWNTLRSLRVLRWYGDPNHLRNSNSPGVSTNRP
jgi:hypothetical protein